MHNNRFLRCLLIFQFPNNKNRCIKYDADISKINHYKNILTFQLPMTTTIQHYTHSRKNLKVG